MAYEEEAEENDDYGESEDAFGDAAREAFPNNDWDEDSLAAFKEAIRICVEKDDGEIKPKGGLALLFGPGPKKKRG